MQFPSSVNGEIWLQFLDWNKHSFIVNPAYCTEGYFFNWAIKNLLKRFITTAKHAAENAIKICSFLKSLRGLFWEMSGYGTNVWNKTFLQISSTCELCNFSYTFFFFPCTRCIFNIAKHLLLLWFWEIIRKKVDRLLSWPWQSE